MIDKKKDRSLDELKWEKLGFSKEYIRSRTSVKYDGDLFVDPPDHVIKKTVAECVKVVEEDNLRKREFIKNERINRSLLWRFWYWFKDCL